MPLLDGLQFHPLKKLEWWVKEEVKGFLPGCGFPFYRNFISHTHTLRLSANGCPAGGRRAVDGQKRNQNIAQIHHLMWWLDSAIIQLQMTVTDEWGMVSDVSGAGINLEMEIKGCLTWNEWRNHRRKSERSLMKQLKRNTAEGECGGESVAKRSQINCTKILCKKPKLERHVC